MADNVIDELQLKFSANASGTNRSLGTLASKLREIKEGVAGIGSSTNELNQFSSALQKLSSIDGKNLTAHVNALKKLSNIKFDNLSKPIDISVKADSITSATRQIEDFKGVMSGLSKNNIKDTGITSFVNSVRRLSEVDLSKFDTNTFNSVAEGVQSIAAIPDISDKVIRLVNALAKLSKAGDQIKTVSSALPELGGAIQKVAVGLASSGGIPSEILAFVTALGQLANAGNKTSTTATQLASLSTSLKEFFASMQNAPIVSENALRMTEALGQLANAGSKTGAAAKSVTDSMNRIGSARLDGIKGAIKDLGSALEKVAGKAKSAALKIFNSLMKIGRARPSLMSTTNTIRNMIAAMIGFRGITGFASLLKETIELGANLTEIDHIVESVFGDMSGAVDSWAKSAITEFGIAEHSAKQYAGVLSSMFQASQIGYKDAGKMAMDLVGLAGDLSAFYNIDTETAYNKIRSGMAGMVRPLRDLGIDLTAATLQEYALSQGITKSYSAMTQAEKVMLRYQYLMANTTTQQGDFQRTNLSLANSLRTLKAYVQAVGTQIGAGLGSAIRHVVVWLNKLMAMLLKAATAFATFMQTIFGKYKGGASGIAIEGLGDSVDYADELGDAADSAASGLGNAADAAKELKKDLSVLPFDELNQLNKDEQAAASASGSPNVGTGGVGGIGDIMDGLLDIEDMDDSPLGKLPEWFSKWAKAMKDAVKVKDFQKLGKIIAEGLNVGIDKLYNALDPEKAKKKIFPFIDAFTTTFNSVVKYLDWEKLGRSLGNAINIAVSSLNRIIEGVNWKLLGSQLAKSAFGFIDEIEFYDVGRLIGNKIMIVWNLLNGFVHDFPWEELGVNIGALINGLFDYVDFSVVADTLATGLNGLFTTLDATADEIEWGNIAENITDGITKFIRTFKWKKNGKALGKFMDDLLDTLIAIAKDAPWEELGQGIADFLEELPWGKLLYFAGVAIVDGLGGILLGMASTPAGIFADGIIGFLLTYQIGSKLTPFVDKIGKAITNDQSFSIIATAFSSLLEGGWAMAIPVVGVVAGVSAIAYEGMQKVQEMTTVMEHWTVVMENSKKITGEQADELLRIAEDAEAAGLSTEESSALIIQALENMGFSAEEIDAMLDEMTTTIYGSSDSFWALKRAIDSADSAISAIMPNIENTVRRHMDQVNDIWWKNGSQVAAVAEKQAGDLETWQKNVSDFRESVVQHLSQIGQSWGEVDTEQGDALGQLTSNLESANTDMETAITNMETLNNSGLDRATVQAIINQIDPSSQAMNDLIGHMNADDETWQQFYDKIEENLVLTDSINAAADGMAEDFAEATKPEFVQIGEDFKVEAGKIGGFMIDGLKEGVFESTDEAVDAMRSVAASMQKGFKDEDQINSPSKVYEDFAKNDLAGFIHGLYLHGSEPVDAMKNIVTNIEGAFKDAPKEFLDIGFKIGDYFQAGLRAGFYNVASHAEDAVSMIKFAFERESLEDQGRALAETFADGFRQIHVEVPHLYISGWNTLDYGNGVTSYPNFSVVWYRKGGLFKGGNGQIIGVGEDNRDEAVLPLEDRRAMSKIGSAIAEAGGSNGISDEAIDKLAGAIADIIVNTQSSRNDGQMNYIELKVEEEVLARAVTRGQQKLDYRNNPTPQMA